MTSIVTMHMAAAPVRKSQIDITLSLPAGSTQKERKILEKTARTYPVFLCLHTDIKKQITF